MNEEQLKAHLKTKQYKNAYFIYGEEAYLKEYYVGYLKKQLVDPAFEDFNLHVYEDKSSQLEEALKDAQIFPMMSEYSVVIVKDYPITRSQRDVKLLLEYLDDPNEQAVLIMVYDTLELDEKTATFKKVTDAFDRAGAVVNLKKRSLNDIARIIEKGAGQRGSFITYDNALYLISVAGDDMKVLINELDKLALFAKDGEITKDIINNMATKSLQAQTYEIADALVKSNLQKAFAIVDTLLELKVRPENIVASIGGYFVDLYRVKCAKAAGQVYDDVGKYFNYKKRFFVLKNASRDCASFTEKQLRSAIDAVCDADHKLKSTAIDNRLLIEELLIKLMMIIRGDAYAQN